MFSNLTPLSSNPVHDIPFMIEFVLDSGSRMAFSGNFLIFEGDEDYSTSFAL